MQDKTISELIEELRNVRIRESAIIEELEEVVRETTRREREDANIFDVDENKNGNRPAVTANGLRIRIGD